MYNIARIDFIIFPYTQLESKYCRHQLTAITQSTRPSSDITQSSPLPIHHRCLSCAIKSTSATRLADAHTTSTPSIRAQSTVAKVTTSASGPSTSATNAVNTQPRGPILLPKALTEILATQVEAPVGTAADATRTAVFADDQQQNFWSAWRFWRTAYSGADRDSRCGYRRSRYNN